MLTCLTAEVKQTSVSSQSKSTFLHSLHEGKEREDSLYEGTCRDIELAG